jgi:cold-inducible RNA-binding protein
LLQIHFFFYSFWLYLNWFTPFGSIQSAQVMQDRDIGRSKGFGFDEMDNDAQAVIQGLNDREHGGRRLTVSEARPREVRGGSSGGRSRGGYAGSGGRRY